jgi:2-polyprenyl-6-methoxyphenol hydroxylase-like FAD-dependent oxidoreductase
MASITTHQAYPVVLVVGAGPTGLTMACDLARRGVRVRIVDGAQNPFTGSRGKGLQPRSLEVLDNLGLAGRLMSLGRFRIPLRFYDNAGSYRDIDLSDGAEPTFDSPYARTLLIAQWRVEETLRDRLQKDGITVEWGKTVTGLAQYDEHIDVAFSDGSVATARYLVGADGGSSSVRHLLNVPFLGKTDEDERMLLGDVRLDGVDRDFWHIWSRAEGGSLAICPLPATDTFQIQIAIEPGDTTEASAAGFQSIIDATLGLGKVLIREATWLSTWRLNVRMVNHFRVGRVFLAGDAAHVHSPAGGQGMNTGIQDALNLGWKLAAVVAGAPTSLLDTYEAERLPIAAALLGFTSRLMEQQPGTHSADTQEMLQLGVTYRDGPLAGIASEPAYTVQAGDRAPDAPCTLSNGRTTHLFNLQRGNRWTLYGFGVRPPDLEPVVHAFEIGVDVQDTIGAVRKVYEATEGDFVLVRPDGYVGLRTRDARDIAIYLNTVLGTLL